MTFLPSKSDNEVVPFVEAHEKAGAFAPIVNAMAVEAIANMHRIEIQTRLRSSRRSHSNSSSVHRAAVRGCAAFSRALEPPEGSAASTHFRKRIPSGGAALWALAVEV